MLPTTALIAFGLLTMILITIEIFYVYLFIGFGYGLSSNRPPVEKTPMGLRIERTYRNQIESASYIVPALAAAAILGLDSSAATTAALLIIVGRAVYAVLYYTGIPALRILGFTTTSISTLYIYYLVFTAMA
ncbi:MAG: MAPEG family protein [Pseudomonadota bacterium]